MSHRIIVVAVLGLGAARSVAAQPRPARRAAPVPVTQGWVLGAHTVVAAGTRIEGPDVDGTFSTSRGEGAGIQVGYGFTPKLLAFATFDAARQASEVDYILGSVGLSHLEIGGRYHLTDGKRRLVPYATAVLGKRYLKAGNGFLDDQYYSLKLSGTEIGVGAGALYAIAPGFSIDAALLATQGKFNRAVYRGDIDDNLILRVHGTTTTRLKVGVQWAPARRGRK